MKMLLNIFLTSLTILFLTGCGKEEVRKTLSFHVGSSTKSLPTSAARSMIKMPQSGFAVITNTNFFMFNTDIERVDVAQVQTPDGGLIDGLWFKTTDSGSKKLFTATAANLNNYIVVKFQSQPIGLRKIDMTIDDGSLFVILDFDKEIKSGKGEKMDAFKLADEINASIETANKILEANK